MKGAQYIPHIELPETNIVEIGTPKTAVSRRTKDRHGRRRELCF